MMETKEINFEKELKRLDDIVEKISSKVLPLDESLKLYEEGLKIIKDLQSVLDISKDKIEKVIEINNEKK